MPTLDYAPHCETCKHWEKYENPELFAPPNSKDVELSRLGKCSCPGVNSRLRNFPPDSSSKGIYISRLPVGYSNVIISTENNFVCFDYEKHNV